MTFGQNRILNKSGLLFVFLLSLCVHPLRAQQQDSLQEDSLKIYRRIKALANKSSITRLAYKFIFVDPAPREYPKSPVTIEAKPQVIVNPYIKYRKKIIRHINIEVYDPFGHSLTDTCCRKLNAVQRAGNSLHMTTREWVIKNRLLFKENDTINPLALSETERLMRDAVYVNDAKVFVTKTNSNDSVDVNVIVVDKWPITVPFLLTDISASARLRNQNLFGLGQQFEQYVKVTKPDLVQYSGYYNIANIDNTYISSLLGYQADQTQNYTYLNINRSFFSPLVKWAWGANFSNQWKYYSYTDTIESLPKRIPVDNFNYDAWGQRAFKLSKDKSFFNQSTNLLAGMRYYSNVFFQRPGSDIDPHHSNYRTSAALGNIGFALQQYYKDRYIYRFGANEDVPEGLIVQFIYGGLKPEFSKIRYYLGGEVARAKHFKIGYFNTTLSYGVFFNEKVSNDVTGNFNISYFSNVARSGRWLFRQFFSYKVVHGENKINHETVSLSTDELYGFQSQSLSGNTKMVFNSETVAYAPYNIAGFRFAPVMQAGMAALGDPMHPLVQSRLYQGYALGLMVRNENLLASTFQFSVGFYPFFPDDGNYKFVYNPITSFTLRVRTFSVNRPEFVSYN
jgi:hypothetical protein